MSFWKAFSPDETTYYPLSDQSIYWKMKAPSFADERKLATFLMAERRPLADVTAQELALTFVETTFPQSGNAPAPKSGDAPEKIIAFINDLPALVVSEMWEHLKEVAPNWGPDFPRPNRRKAGTQVGDGERAEGSHSPGGE